MHIGYIEGYEVTYNKDRDTLTCKDVEITRKSMLEAYKSGLDRVEVESGLMLKLYENKVTLGCFTLTLENSKKLIQIIKKIKI